MADLTRKTENLLNYKEITTTPNYATVTLITNGVNLTGKYMATIDISLEVGSTYKMSWLQEVVSGTADTGWRYKYTDNTYSNYGSNGGGIIVEKDVSQVLLYVTKSNNTASVNYTNIMLSKGSTAKPYEPYGWVHSLRKLTTATEAVENPLYSDGTAITNYTIKGNTVQSGTPTPSNPVDVQGVGIKTANLLNIAQPIVISVPNYVYNGDFTFSGESITYKATFYCSIAMVDNNDNEIINQAVSANTALTVSTPNGIKSLRIYSPNALTEGYIMLNAGSTALPYEPYGYKIPISSGQQTIDIYIGDLPLLKSLDGTAVDEISNGTLTRRVDSDGSVLPTPTTTQITMPSIPTTEGANSITVDTTVQPSEFTATWTGWHDSSVKEYDGSDWQ